MRKIVAFVLSLTLIFTSFSIVSLDAATIKVSEEARALETIGMLEGDGGGVTSEYMTKKMTRFTAAISILKLRGLYYDALAYRGIANFNDIDEVKWEEGKKILAYLKANPDLGFIGNERGEFLPYKSINEKEYYKVLLETLGYKQKTNGKSGDFTWDDTLEYAKSIGLKPTYKAEFNIDLLAKATVSALNTKTKAGKVYINVLIDEGKVKKSRAITAGLIKEELDVAIKSVKAVGNTVVEIVFDEDVNMYDAENIYNYSIDGLTIKDAVFIGNNTVRLDTSAQSSGKLYTLKAGKIKIKFTGVSKVSGSPSIKMIKSEDVETVTVEFNKELDFLSAANMDNYYISGVNIEKAEVEGKKVTLSTYGLLSRKQYTLKVTNIKSVDGSLLKSQSKTFFTRPDTYPPNVKDVKAETNQRVIVSFSEAVSKETAEDLYNYTIKSSNGELEIYDAKLFGDDEDKVELTTETQKSSVKYEITIDNIADKTKAANVMKRAVKKTFYGMREDRSAPQLSRNDIKVLSGNHIQLAFTDNSRMDEASVLDPSNYEIIKNDRYKNEIYVLSTEKASYEDGKYKVILEVDDLDINISYTIKVYNIADEFGNVLEKNNTLSISVRRDDFAASTVKDYKVVNGSEIEIYFTKPLNKETAEDISNYEINNSVGHPTKAVYKDEKVTLNTATMVEGKIYKLTIDGVRDLANHTLRLTFEFRATDGERDETSPRLEYIYSENKYVVSAVFDEPVRYTSDGSNRTILVLKSGNNEITLYAKALSEDDRVIEFSNVEGKKTILGYSTIYTIDKEKSLKGITDKSINRNKFDTNDLKYYDLLIYGNNEEPEPPTVEYITQRDGKTFEVLMSKEVVIKKNDADATPSATFKVYYTDDKDIVTFAITSSRYIDGNKDYKIDISKVLEDKHGVKAENTESNYTIFYGEYTDDDKPYIVDVTALDRFTVEIEYNEAIGYEGKYTIKNTDDSAYYKTISNTLKKIDNNKVILSLNNPLEGRYDYYLIIDVPAKDLVGNSSEDVKGDEFYFIGTDLTPVKVPDVDYKEAESLVIKLENALVDLSDLDKINTAKVYLNNASKEVALVSDLVMRKSLNDRIAVAEEKIQLAEDKLAAVAVIKKIDALPMISEITLEHKAAVESAREDYNGLTDAQKELVTNYEKLKSAEDKLAATAVINKIDVLPKLEDITLEHKAAVESTREAYNGLTEAQEKLVTNYSRLVEAEGRIAELVAEQERLEEEKRQREADMLVATTVINKIDALPELSVITLENKAAVESAREAYNELTEAQKGLVTNYEKLTKAESKIADLIAEQERLEEEKRQREAEEKAKLTALKEAVGALEIAADNVINKANGLSVKNEEMDKALSAYISPHIPEGSEEAKVKTILETSEKNAITAIAAAETAAKEADTSIEAVASPVATADEAYEKVSDGEEKIILLGRIDAAKSKIENASKTILEAKDKISEAKIKAASKGLTVDAFKFNETAKADSDTPIILPLATHKTGATYQYKEIGKMVDGKFVKEDLNKKINSKLFRLSLSGSENANLQFVDEINDGKTIRSIKVTRGADAAVITLKVEIVSGNKIGYKLFNINIPPKSLDSLTGNVPVTIEEVSEKIDS